MSAWIAEDAKIDGGWGHAFILLMVICCGKLVCLGICIHMVVVLFFPYEEVYMSFFRRVLRGGVCMLLLVTMVGLSGCGVAEHVGSEARNIVVGH